MGCCGSKAVLQAERRAQLESFEDVEEIPEAEYDAAMDVITAAFSGSATQEGAADMHWALGPKFEALDNPQRHDLIRFSMKMVLLKYVKDGAVVIGRHVDGELKAVAAFTRSRGYHVPPCDTLDYIVIVAGLMKTAPPFIKESRGLPPAFQKNLESIGKVEAEFHKKHGKGPHYHVQFAAVEPAAQGRGHSSKLLRRVNELADAESLPCFLFTTGPKEKASKVAIYARFGYETVEERTITDADGRSVTCYGMVRNEKM